MSLAEAVAESVGSLCGRVCDRLTQSLRQCGKVSGNHQNIHSRKHLARKQYDTYTLLIVNSGMDCEQCWMDYTRTELQPSQQGNVALFSFRKDQQKNVTPLVQLF